MKTASRTLGSAFFRSGFEVQDAPRYGAERRGAPTFAYVRASRAPIHERGVIVHPDLVIVADDTLVAVASAGVMQGIGDSTVMLMYTNEDADVWKRRLNVRGPVVALPRVVLPSNAQLAEDPSLPFVGSMLAGAAARLVGAIPQEALSAAVRQEVGHLGLTVALENERHALAAFAAMAPHERAVAEAGDVRADRYEAPQWIDLGPEEARLSDPAIHASATSVRAKTGAWRTMRPVVDESRCNRCWWICSTFCPDSAIAVSAEGKPVIDYDHCKGCMICVAICPTHVIAAVPETGGPTGEPRERCAESS